MVKTCLAIEEGDFCSSGFHIYSIEWTCSLEDNYRPW